MTSEHSGQRPRHGVRSEGGAKGVFRVVLGFGARYLNPLIRRLAGRPSLPLLAVVEHRGRRSGRWYTTPVAGAPTADGFVIPLTFGQAADWVQNVRTAGGCVIRWRGINYRVAEPEVIDWATARSAFHPIERILIALFGIEQFVRLRHAPVGDEREVSSGFGGDLPHEQSIGQPSL